MLTCDTKKKKQEIKKNKNTIKEIKKNFEDLDSKTLKLYLHPSLICAVNISENHNMNIL